MGAGWAGYAHHRGRTALGAPHVLGHAEGGFYDGGQGPARQSCVGSRRHCEIGDSATLVPAGALLARDRCSYRGPVAASEQRLIS